MSGEATHFYGESGSGKTSIALQSAIECVKHGFLCIYISSERFSSERLKQLMGYDTQIGSDILVFKTRTFDEQTRAINKIPQKIEDEEKELGLVVVDGLTSFYAPSSFEKEERIRHKKELANQLVFLLGNARKRGFSLIFLNQVYRDIDTDELKPRGGRLVMDVCSNNVELKKTKGSKRLAILRKPNFDPIDSASFTIKEEGIL